MKKIAVFFVCLAVLINAAAFVASAESGDGNSSVIDEDLDAGNDDQSGSAEDPAAPDDGPADPDNPADTPQDTDDDIDAPTGVEDPADSGNGGDTATDPEDEDTDTTGSPDDGADDADDTEDTPVDPKDTADDADASGPDDQADNAKDPDDTEKSDSSQDIPAQKDEIGTEKDQTDDPKGSVQEPTPATTPAKPPAKEATPCMKKTTEAKENTKDGPEEKTSEGTYTETEGGISGNNIVPVLTFFPLQRIEPMQLAPLAPPKVEEGFICFIEDFIFGKDMILHNNSIRINNVTLANDTTERKTTQTVAADILSVKGRENCNVTLAILHMDAPAELFEQTINHTMAMEKSNTVEVRFDGLKIREGDLIVIAVTSPDRIKLYDAGMYKAVFSQYKDEWVLFNLTD